MGLWVGDVAKIAEFGKRSYRGNFYLVVLFNRLKAGASRGSDR